MRQGGLSKGGGGISGRNASRQSPWHDLHVDLSHYTECSKQGYFLELEPQNLHALDWHMNTSTLDSFSGQR